MADMVQTAIFELKIDPGKQETKIAELTADLKAAREANTELEKSWKVGKISLDDYGKQSAANKRIITELNAELKAETKILDLHSKQTQAAAGSNEQLRAQLALLTAQHNKAGEAEKESTEVGQRRAEAVLALSDALKANEKAVGDNRRNVGNYENSLAGLEQKLKDLLVAQKSMDIDSAQFQQAQGEIDETTSKLGLLSGKFDEFGNREPKSPIKREMDAIADATAGAISAFEVYNLTMGDSEDQSAAQERALRAIAVAQNLRNIQIGIANAGEAAGVIISKGATLATAAQTKATVVATGVQRVYNTVLKANPIGIIITLLAALAAGFVFMTDKFKVGTKVLDFMNEKFSGFMKIVQEVGESLGLLDSANDKALANFGRLTEGVEANIRVLEAQGGKEREVFALREKLAADELTLLRKKLAEKGELDKEELKRFRELKTDLEVLRLEERNRLAKAAEDDAKEADRQQKERIKEQEERIKLGQDANKRLLEDGKALIEAQLLNSKEGSRRYLELQEKLVHQQLRIENSNSGILLNQRKLNELRASSEILKLRSEFYEKVALKEMEFQGGLNVTKASETQAAKDQLKDLNQTTFAAMEEGRQKAIEDAQAQAQAKIDAAKYTKERLVEIDLAYLDTATETTNALSSLVALTAGQSEEAANFQRALAIFQIGIDTAKAVTKGIASAQDLPFPGNLVAMASTVATVLANIAQAKQMMSEASAPKAPKFKGALGGVLEGPSHLNGGIRGTGRFANVELEGGEAVINKNSTAKYRSLLSAINQAGGGIPLVPTNYAAVGGIVLQPSARQMSMEEALRPAMVQPTTVTDYKMMQAAFSQALKNMPPSINRWSDFNDFSTHQNYVKNKTSQR